MLSNLKLKLYKSIKSKKLNVFAFFLVLSFLFLMLSKLSKTYIETIIFHVKYENVPEHISIMSNVDSIVKVKVKAYGFKLLPQNFYRHTITVDFKNETRKNGQTFIWDTKNGISKINAKLGSKIEMLSVQPDSLSFHYEIMTVKTVPIKLNADISYAIGFDAIDGVIIKPDSVNIIGPKNNVEKITQIKTNKLTLKTVNSSIDKEVDLVLDKSIKDVKLSRSKVKVLANVEKFTEGIYDVPITMINLPSDVKLNYFPKTIEVSYYVSLNNYNKVKALDFKIICDYNEIKNEDRTYVTPQLIEISKLVKSAKMKQNKVEFIIIE